MKSVKGSLKEKIALLRLKQGDSEAFGYLYDVYVDKIYRFVFFRVSDKALAHDITQETFLQTWEYIVDEKKIKNLQSFIYRVAYNKVIDYYRSSSRQTVLIQDVSDTDMKKIASDRTSEQAEWHVLHRHIVKLKPEFQDVIILKHVEGLSINEIGEIIDKEPTNVRVILHRAMNALKEIYKPKEKN